MSLNFALVGCGRISQSYLDAIEAVPECRLRAVVDSREAVAQSVAEQFGCRWYTDCEAAVRENDLDAAVVCTPPNTHRDLAVLLLESGIHVLCEKPLALNSAEAAEMADCARKSGKVMMMGSKFRYVDDVIKAKSIVLSGILGEVLLFENVFCAKIDMRQRWNAKPEISGGGVLIDNGSHSIDIARYLLGPIEKVQAEEGRRLQCPEVEDTCRLYLRTTHGVMGAVDLSWSLSKERDSYIDLFGTEGMLSIGWKASRYRQTEKSPWVQFGAGYDKRAAFARQLTNFVGVIHGREQPLIGIEDAVASVRVIEAAYRSMAENKWVQVMS